MIARVIILLLAVPVFFLSSGLILLGAMGGGILPFLAGLILASIVLFGTPLYLKKSIKEQPEIRGTTEVPTTPSKDISSPKHTLFVIGATCIGLSLLLLLLPHDPDFNIAGSIRAGLFIIGFILLSTAALK